MKTLGVLALIAMIVGMSVLAVGIRAEQVQQHRIDEITMLVDQAN